MRVFSRLGALAALGATLGCNDGLQPIPVPTSCPHGFVGICGTVHFVGAVPDSTQAVYVIAYPTFPTSRNDLFNFQPSVFNLQALPLPGPGDSDSVFYAVTLPNGRYEWVLAAWVKQGFTPQNADSTLREAGFFRDSGDTTVHGSGIVVVNGTGTDSIDFTIDFTKMHPVSFYFPPLQ